MVIWNGDQISLLFCNSVSAGKLVFSLYTMLQATQYDKL